MGKALARNHFLGTALLLSLLVHGFVAFVFPPFSHVSAVSPVEIISFDKTKRIEIEHRATVASHRSRPPVRIAVPPHPKQPPVLSSKRAPNGGTPPPAAVAEAAAPAPVTANLANGAVAPQRVAPGPRATATVDTVKTAATERHVAGGYMPFGASDPTPVLEPAALAGLQKLNVHVTLLIVVSDDGRTKSVTFNPPLGHDIEDQIQTLLASANWDPAYCGGGIPCESTTTIKL